MIPYVQRHETEALVLASLHGLGDWLGSPEAVDGLGRLQEELRDLAPKTSATARRPPHRNDCSAT
ncbi:MAG: hypothetical protein R3B99_32960 [Polyangiales bacterium]